MQGRQLENVNALIIVAIVSYLLLHHGSKAVSDKNKTEGEPVNEQTPEEAQPNNNSDANLYLIATNEVEEVRPVTELWAKAIAIHFGDKGKAKYEYIKMRVADLSETSSQSPLAVKPIGHLDVGVDYNDDMADPESNSISSATSKKAQSNDAQQGFRRSAEIGAFQALVLLSIPILAIVLAVWLARNS